MKKGVVIIGAGPYGLASGAFLKRAGFDVQLYGDVMGFWQAMPRGMFLRSYFRASNIADPDGAYGLRAVKAAFGRTLFARPIPLADFIEYGHWFRERLGIPVDSRRVTKLMRTGVRVELSLDDDATVEAERVVVATGITPFLWNPRQCSKVLIRRSSPTPRRTMNTAVSTVSEFSLSALGKVHWNLRPSRRGWRRNGVAGSAE